MRCLSIASTPTIGSPVSGDTFPLQTGQRISTHSLPSLDSTMVRHQGSELCTRAPMRLNWSVDGVRVRSWMWGVGIESARNWVRRLVGKVQVRSCDGQPNVRSNVMQGHRIGLTIRYQQPLQLGTFLVVDGQPVG